MSEGNTAVGIHDHPNRKLGRRPPKQAPALLLADFLTGAVPDHPIAADHIGKLEFGLYGNDKYGVCGPTSVANLVRAVTAGLLGAEIKPSQDDVFDLYRRSGNPNFDPQTDADDNGVDMQTMLEALLAGGIGDEKPLCFAKVDVGSDAELDAAVSIFGGVLWGINLLAPQQQQTDEGEWDYAPGDEWGRHAVLNAAFDETAKLEEVVTWALPIETTASFRRHQLEEAWVVIWQWNLDHPSFQAGVDVQALANAYHSLTGKTIPDLPTPTPVPPPPAPTPTPEPPGGSGVGPFLVGPFSDHVATRLAERAQAKDMTVEQYLTWHIQHGSTHWKD